MAQAITVTSPLGPDVLVFSKLVGVEELGRPFELQLELYSEDNKIALDRILGQNVTVKIAFPTGGERYFNGDVSLFRQVTRSKDRYSCYEAVVRPKLWFLNYTSDCRIFQNKSVPDIIKLVLDEHGQTDVTRSLSKTYAAREYCVQYNESDFDFLSRLMEEEGIYYYFKHASGKHTLVLADSYSAHQLIASNSGKVPFMAKRSDLAVAHIYDWQVSQQVQTGAFVHTDFDFEKPRTDLKANSTISRTHQHAQLERFMYPGNYVVKDVGTGAARTRIEELQTEWEVVGGSTNCTEFAAGELFKLDSYSRQDQNREHLLTWTRYDIQMETDTAAGTEAGAVDSEFGVQFDCQFKAIASARPFRSACTTPKPVVRGPQTAIVVGKSGEEIWTDKYGRVKVQFHWDRLGQKNEASSCWLRVAQAWAGKNWGAMQIPRIGQEVIVDFLEGDPDQPIITGRVYNGDHLPPYDLPANQTQSGLKSRSTKEGTAETFNELRFEDKKGAEQIYFHAQKNFDRVVENNDTLKVGFETKDAGDQTIDIYNNRTATLEEGTDKLQVKKGNREALIDKGNDTVTIAEGNQTITISQGNQTITIEAGKGSIEAAQELVLKVGESTIKITPSSIELTSVNIKLTANGKLALNAPQTAVDGTGTLDLNGGMITIN